MGTAYRFVADPAGPSEVVDWFRSLSSPPLEAPAGRGLVLHFQNVGPLSMSADGNIDPKASPLATVFPPRLRRGVLWTVGEVHFLPTPLRKLFPGLHSISVAFSRWLSERDCVFSVDRATDDFSHYLEGSVRNHDQPIFAFPSGLAALRSGRYFVGDDDNEYMLDRLCTALRLRGVTCEEA